METEPNATYTDKITVLERENKLLRDHLIKKQNTIDAKNTEIMQLKNKVAKQRITAYLLGVLAGIGYVLWIYNLLN